MSRDSCSHSAESRTAQWSRRSTLAGVFAAAVTAQAAKAAVVCTPFDWNGVQLCDAGLQVAGVTARQSKQNWCWAACIETIFRFHGYRVDQGRIVEKVFGSLIDTPANSPQIVYGVDGDWESDDGRSFEARAEVLWDTAFSFGRPDAAAQAAQELATGHPLILGALGHAVVLTGMKYQRDMASNGRVYELTVRDPWPFSPNRRQLNGYEAMGTQFLAKVAIS